MRYIYYRDNFGRPIKDSCSADLLREMFWFCSLRHRIELSLFLQNEEDKSIEFEFKDGDKVIVSRSI